jgi:hypothetical protein
MFEQLFSNAEGISVVNIQEIQGSKCYLIEYKRAAGTYGGMTYDSPQKNKVWVSVDTYLPMKVSEEYTDSGRSVERIFYDYNVPIQIIMPVSPTVSE